MFAAVPSVACALAGDLTQRTHLRERATVLLDMGASAPNWRVWAGFSGKADLMRRERLITAVHPLPLRWRNGWPSVLVSAGRRCHARRRRCDTGAPTRSPGLSLRSRTPP